jgi:hypothetical protein
MRRIVRAVAMLIGLFTVTSASAGQWDEVHRRPIDNVTGVFLDHTYSLKYCSAATCSAGWSCGEAFGGGCDCAGQSDCTVIDAGWERYGTLSGWQCAEWLSTRLYGVWGVCHQASANIDWYVTGSAGGVPLVTRGWGASVAMYGTFGADGGAGCY